MWRNDTQLVVSKRVLYMSVYKAIQSDLLFLKTIFNIQSLLLKKDAGVSEIYTFFL